MTSHRADVIPQRSTSAVPANRAKLDAVEPIAKVADDAGLTMIQLALGFVTAHPGVTSAIIGPRTMEHLDSQLAAADTVLTPRSSTPSTRSLPRVSISRPTRRSTPLRRARRVAADGVTGDRAAPSFGIATAPQQVDYADLLRVWREADAIPEIEHAWLFDHLLPIGGDPHGPIFEGWTLLAALAAQTSRLRLGLLVTSNRFRPPAMLAKIAATVDIVSGGRLDFGIGAGSRPSVPTARREYDAHGLPYLDAADAVGSLAEACTIIKRLWTEDEPFDFDGRYAPAHRRVRATRSRCSDRTRRSSSAAGRAATLRVVAEHADVWNYPGDDIDDAARPPRDARRLLRRDRPRPGRDHPLARAAGRLRRPRATRTTIARALDAGFPHLVLSLPAPYPDGVARWVADEARYVTPTVRAERSPYGFIWRVRSSLSLSRRRCGASLSDGT